MERGVGLWRVAAASKIPPNTSPEPATAKWGAKGFHTKISPKGPHRRLTESLTKIQHPNCRVNSWRFFNSSSFPENEKPIWANSPRWGVRRSLAPLTRFFLVCRKEKWWVKKPASRIIVKFSLPGWANSRTFGFRRRTEIQPSRKRQYDCACWRNKNFL